jgi:hypothetical protein
VQPYPAVVNPNPRAARTASGTGSAVIENGVFDMYAAHANMGEAVRTAAYIWTERATRQHMEQQRRERESQAIFLRRMAGLMLESSHNLEASSHGVPSSVSISKSYSSTEYVGTTVGAMAGQDSDSAAAASASWPLWTWDGFFRDA